MTEPLISPELAAYLDEKMRDFASVEELTAATNLLNPGGLDFSSSTSAAMWIAPFHCELTWAALVSNRGAGVLHPLSDTKYWNVQLRRWRTAGQSSPVSEIIAQKSTRATATPTIPAGEAAVARKAWVFHASTFDTSLAKLQPGDVVDFGLYATTPDGQMTTPWYSPLLGQIGYRPL